MMPCIGTIPKATPMRMPSTWRTQYRIVNNSGKSSCSQQPNVRCSFVGCGVAHTTQTQSQQPTFENRPCAFNAFSDTLRSAAGLAAAGPFFFGGPPRPIVCALCESSEANKTTTTVFGVRVREVSVDHNHTISTCRPT